MLGCFSPPVDPPSAQLSLSLRHGGGFVPTSTTHLRWTVISDPCLYNLSEREHIQPWPLAQLCRAFIGFLIEC